MFTLINSMPDMLGWGFWIPMLFALASITCSFKIALEDYEEEPWIMATIFVTLGAFATVLTALITHSVSHKMGVVWWFGAAYICAWFAAAVNGCSICTKLKALKKSIVPQKGTIKLLIHIVLCAVMLYLMNYIMAVAAGGL